MNLDNGYYKKIIYKKNAFEDLKTYIKLNFSNKNICLITTKSVPVEEVTELLNALFCGTEKVIHICARNGFDNNELKKICTKINDNNFNLLISFGGGSCANVVKYFAHNFNLPYIVCPSSSTSLAYFSPYCINPFNNIKSFLAKMPIKIYIKESVISKGNCLLNINGLCFLHSLRMFYLEEIIENKEESGVALIGLEKLFDKLENEQTNILLCSEDSNLILMDLLIDFAFFINMLKFDNFMVQVYKLLSYKKENSSLSGQNLLLICKSEIVLIKQYLEINFYKMMEMPNFKKLQKLTKNYKNIKNNIKNNNYFVNLMQNIAKKRELINKKEQIYSEVCFHLSKIKVFIKAVKSVFKSGIDIKEKLPELFNAIMLAPFINDENILIDFIAGSGVLNGLAS